VDGSKLQKDLKAYLLAVKTMHDASRRMQDCLAEMYEPEWFGKEEVDAMAEEMIEKEMDNNLEDTDATWTDYHEKVTDDSLVSLDTYLAKFPDIKKGKKKDEAKIAKPVALLEMAAPSWAQGLLSAHQVAQTNLSMNQLPVLYESRIGVYVNTFQNLAAHQEKFHRDMGKLNQNLNDVMTKLDEQRLDNDGANHSTAATDSPPTTRLCPPPDRPTPSLSRGPSPGPDDYANQALGSGPAVTSPTSMPQPEQPSAGQEETQPPCEAPQSWVDPESSEGLNYEQPSYAQPRWDEDSRTPGDWGDAGEGVQNAVTEGDEELPQGFLYKVKAVHDYTATDGDELELKSGDTVLVLAFDCPDEQDDGWLVGVKESHWLENKDISIKGVFPENFTQKV
ncbi:hypothetical protein NHX12_014928, partial [Muraenolepis orangiensis]